MRHRSSSSKINNSAFSENSFFTTFFVVLLLAFCLFSTFAQAQIILPSTTTANVCTQECTGGNSSLCQANKDGAIATITIVAGIFQRVYAFCPTVDDYSMLQLNGSYNFISGQADENTTIFMNINSFISSAQNSSNTAQYLPESRYFYNIGLKTYSAFYTIVVELKAGALFAGSIRFVNSCVQYGKYVGETERCNLGDGPCVRNSDCGVALDTTNTKLQDTNKDVKIYIAWTGTDRYNKPLTSKGLLSDNFRSYTIGGYVDQLVKMVTPK